MSLEKMNISIQSFPPLIYFLHFLCSSIHVVEQVRKGRWPIDTWRRLRTASQDFLHQEAWPAQLFNTTCTQAVTAAENKNSVTTLESIMSFLQCFDMVSQEYKVYCPLQLRL